MNQPAVLKVTKITVGAFQENCFLVADEETGSLAVVDPGSDAGAIISEIDRSGHSPQAIWLTHAHVDHIGAVAPIRERWDVPVWLHPLDLPLYRVGGRQAQLYGIPFDEPPPVDEQFSDGQEMSLGNLRFTVMHAPGHSPGHVVIHGNGHALVGDCLFAGSIGRTDLPMSNPAHLEASLAKIAALPAETIVHSGHGEDTTIGEERASNPFLNGTARIVRSI